MARPDRKYQEKDVDPVVAEALALEAATEGARRRILEGNRIRHPGRFPEEKGDLPTGESLAAELSQFLRDRETDDPPASS